MSFEGYYEGLCANGHLTTWDCYDDAESKPCSCGSAIVFTHLVDQTNDEGECYPFEVETPAVVQTCNLGHEHVIQPARYKIPSSATATT